MEIKVVQMQRRGVHVMFRLFIEGIEGALRTKEIMQRGRGRSIKVVGYETTNESIPHTWAYVDGYWDGENLLLNPVAFSRAVQWPDAGKYRSAVQDTVIMSEQYARVMKTLRKLG